MSGMTKVAKYALLSLNVLIFASGLIMLIAGAVVQHKINTQNLSKTVGGYSTASGSIVCILFGIFILLLSVGGLFATMKDHYKFLICYAVILALLFLIQIVTGITGLSVKNSGRFNDYVERVFSGEFKFNSTRPRERDNFQVMFRCCGWQSVNDYRNQFNQLEAPTSCCLRPPNATVTCNRNNPNDLFKSSCNMKITDATRYVIEVACSILVVFAILDLSSIVLSLLLSRQIRSGYQYS